MTRPAGHCPVLIVEDDADSARDDGADSSRIEGYETATVANGREALEYLHSTPLAPNVILLDLMMPVMDGWEFHRRLEADPDIAQCR